MSAENIRAVLCDGPTCSQFNDNLKSDLLSQEAQFTTERFCHGACSKAPNAFIKQGFNTLEPIEKATAYKVIQILESHIQNPPEIIP